MTIRVIEISSLNDLLDALVFLLIPMKRSGSRWTPTRTVVAQTVVQVCAVYF